MTITYVGIGSTVSGNNTSLTPSLVAGVVEGDLLLIAASIRNSGTGTVNTPTGWTKVIDLGNVALLGRFYTAGVTAPTVTFANGVANADTQAAMVAFRGVAPDALTQSLSASLSNASAQNIAYPALDTPGANFAVLILAWKQDDATSIAAPAGFTGVINSLVTAGDDASLRLVYQIQTTEADIAASSLTVTGGVAAISKSAVIALQPAAAISVVAQDVYPTRVLVSVTGLTLGDSVQVYREVSGQRTLLRGGATASANDTSFLVVDAELPFGTPIKYVAVVNDFATYNSATATYNLPNGVNSKPALTDAISGDAAEVVIMARGPVTKDNGSTVFRVVGGKNIVVSTAMGQPTGSYQFYIETYSQYQNFMDLIDNATEAVIQLRQGGAYAGYDAYLKILSVEEALFSQDGTDPRRLITLNWAVVDGWADTLEAAGYTLQDIANYYGTSGTLQSIADDFGPTGTLLQIAQRDWGS